MDELDQFINQDNEREAKKKRFINQILDEYGGFKGRHISIRGYMGRTLVDSGRPTQIPTYSAMHSLLWVAQNIRMGSEMDFIRNNLDEDTGKLVIDEQNAEVLRQRAPDWSRQLDLASYLIQEDSHKFGTILAVISPAWVDDVGHEFWGKDGRALENASKFEALDSEGNIGLLNLDDVLVYALDGQHRVMGIRGVSEISEGGIFEKSKEGAHLKKKWNKEELLNKLRSSANDITRVLEEKINIEYIPAVVVGETRHEATKRIRSVFNAINNQAKKPDKGENILLDENNGAHIVARRIGHHPIFRTFDKQTRVDWKRPNNSAHEEKNITTLPSLAACVEYYVKFLKKELSWKPELSSVPIRPSSTELDGVESEIKEILTKLESLPVFERLKSGLELSILREIPTDKNKKAESNLLLWAIGLPILFQSLAKCLSQNYKIDDLISRLIELDTKGAFKMSDPRSIWYLVTYDSMNKKIKPRKTGLPVEAMTHLLIGSNEEKSLKLLEKIIEARKTPESDQQWIGYDGKVQVIPDEPYFSELMK
ncbi:hypothetical protein EOL70_15050 [Leucothrix sargassi]|nr:hypothetical protein EOL70_15050 [Leucothrix sargassi]